MIIRGILQDHETKNHVHPVPIFSKGSPKLIAGFQSKTFSKNSILSPEDEYYRKKPVRLIFVSFRPSISF